VENLVIRPVSFNSFKTSKNSLLKDKNTKIAILSFKDPKNTEVGSFASDMFGSLLKKKGYQILERDKIDKIIREQKIMQTDKTELTNLEIAEKIGKIKAADYMIFGAVTLYQVQPRTIAIPKQIKEQDRKDYEQSYIEYRERYVNGWHLDFWRSQEHRRKQFRRKVNIPSLQDLEDTYKTQSKTESRVIASIGLSVKLVDINTGKILWLAQGETNDFDIVNATRRIITKFIESI
jgi:curli biogenesis system outer membrane secretion channel CsgG